MERQAGIAGRNRGRYLCRPALTPAGGAGRAAARGAGHPITPPPRILQQAFEKLAAAERWALPRKPCGTFHWPNCRSPPFEAADFITL
jgi:hypothetical protein